MGDRPQVAAVAPNSPAAAADVRPGDELLGIGPLTSEELASRSPDATRLSEQAEAALAAHPAESPIHLRLRRGTEVIVRNVLPVRVCGTRFVLKTASGIDAYSDGVSVAVNTGLIAFTRNDDELALILGHELAHAIHGDTKAGGVKQRRFMERRADLLGLALMRCAGYDSNLALGFWSRYDKRDTFGFLRLPTHGSPEKRVRWMRQAHGEQRCPLDASALGAGGP